jgi:hypothetical protein
MPLDLEQWSLIKGSRTEYGINYFSCFAAVRVVVCVCFYLFVMQKYQTWPQCPLFCPLRQQLAKEYDEPPKITIKRLKPEKKGTLASLPQSTYRDASDRPIGA